MYYYDQIYYEYINRCVYYNNNNNALSYVDLYDVETEDPKR